MRVDGDVRAALAGLRGKRGHFAGCAHGAWLGDWNNQKRHQPGEDCPSDVSCTGEGYPCSTKCKDALRALGLLGDRQAAGAAGAL